MKLIFSYGLILVIALFLSLFIIWRLFKNNLDFLRHRITLDLFFDCVFVFLLAFGIGARIQYVFEHFAFFQEQFVRVFLFLHFPGFAFFGGVIGGQIALWVFTRRKKIPFFLLSDLMLVGLALALAIFRIGNILAGDVLGYESLFSAVIFVILYYLYTRGKSQSSMITTYFILLIGSQRFFIEIFRSDSVYLRPVTVAQWFSIVFILVGATRIFIVKRDALTILMRNVLDKARHLKK